MLQRYLTETHSNTFSFLRWDTDGHQYLDMVRFLDGGHQRSEGGRRGAA